MILHSKVLKAWTTVHVTELVLQIIILQCNRDSAHIAQFLSISQNDFSITSGGLKHLVWSHGHKPDDSFPKRRLT